MFFHHTLTVAFYRHFYYTSYLDSFDVFRTPPANRFRQQVEAVCIQLSQGFTYTRYQTALKSKR
jgi:hypothetical protein